MLKPSSKPLPQHIPDFLDWLDVERGLSSKSQENYSRFLKKFLAWLTHSRLEHLKPHELTADHVWRYRVFLARQYLPRTRQPLKKSTQNYYLIALRALLNYFSHRDILSLPAEKVALAKDKGDRQVRFLAMDQVEKLLAVPDTRTPQGIRDRAILETLFSTGMRVSELVSLNREQLKLRPGAIDFELGIIGKGQRTRTVYFSERALEWLRRYFVERTDTDKALFINLRAPRSSPKRLTPRSVEKMIKRYAITAGLPPNTTPHVMRHSFATDLLNQGVDLRTIQEFLGHKSIAATQIYAHVTSKRLRDIHRRFHGGRKPKSA